MVDTGADISVFPATQKDRAHKSDFRLFAANNTKISTYWERMLTLNVGLRRSIKWTFCLADVPYPIMSADLIHHYGLLVDLKQGRLTDPTTGLFDIGIYAPATITSISTVEKNTRFIKLMKKYPAILGSPSNHAPAVHATQHFMNTTGAPCAERVRPLRPDRLQTAKEEFRHMVEMSHARPSTSPWASPLHMAKKGNGEWRPCGDYRKLNARTIPDRYPIALLQDSTANLQGRTIFSTIDLCKAFQYIPVAEQDIPKTAVITPFGLFEFPSMPFGLRNAAQTFQRYIHEALGDLDFVFAYVDDLLVASPSPAKHEEHLNTVFQRLAKYGLCVNADKRVMGADAVNFLGY